MMAYDPQSRPRRGTSDSMYRESSPSRMQIHEEQYLSQPYEPQDSSKLYVSPSVQGAYEGDRRSARVSTEPHGGAQSYIPSSVPDEPIEGRQRVRMSSGLQDGGSVYTAPSLHDEYRDIRRPARMPSPPMSEGSLPTSMEQLPASIANMSPELIEHLTRRIKKEGKFGVTSVKILVKPLTSR
jgi:hypothetical protein